MATTIPIPANQNTTADSRKSTKLATGGASKNVKLDIARRDVARVEVVDTDFVMTTKSGRKILIRDGALNAVTDEEFSVVFSDEEAVSGKVLFSESQSEWVEEAAPLNWSDAAADSASLVVAPVASAGGGISYGVLAGVAVVAAAAGGGGGSSAPAPDNAAQVKAALQAIGTFAKDNADSFPTASGSYVGTPPSRATYETAGVKGVNDFNLASINDALATAVVTDLSVDTLPKLQALVDAYISILNAANGRVDPGATLPNADAYVLIGVNGFGTDITTRAAKAKLLSDVIDRKQISDVDFVKEIQALADQVSAVIAAAQGGTLVKEQLEKLGIVGVTTENFGLVLKSIQGTPDDGSGVQTLSQLQNIVDTIGAAALKVISTFAEDNKDSQPTSSGSYVGTPPDFIIYGIAGVKGVDKQNVNAINDALATALVNGEAVGTQPKLQAVVDAYNAVLSMANGQINATATLPTAQQYTLIGLTGLESKDPQDPQAKLLSAKVRLLGDVIDRKSFGDVDTIKELQSLLNNVAAVINAVNGTQLTKEQLDALGLNGVTPANLALVLAAIDQTSDDGTGIDTLTELQNLIDTINGGSDARSALDMLVKYAQDNGGVRPNEFNYITAGVSSPAGGKVTAKEAEAFNDALLTPSVTGESINTLPKLQGLVDAYRKVFALADGIGNNADSTKDVTLAEYQRIGVSTNPLSNDTHRLLLLNDAIDAQSFEGVNTIDEINNLVRIASAVQDRATGLSTNLSVEDLTKLGVRGVTQDNLGNLINAIAQVGPGGSDSLQELQNLLYSSLSISFDAISEDSGFGPNDFITNDNLLIFTGTTTADSNTKIRLTLKRDGQPDIVLEGDIKQGQWDVRNTVALANGDYTITAQLFDANTLILKTVPFAQHVVVNKQEPATNPLNNNTIAITAIIDDTGASDTDFKTSDTTLIFKGQSNATNGTHVAVEIDGALQWSEVQNGQWTVDNTGRTLAAGSHTIKAYLTDAAGNAASTIATQTLLIDTAQLTLLSKTSGAIGSTSNLLLKFSSAVVGAQGGQIVITDLSQPATPWATISVTDTTQVSINGDTVTINPFLDLVKGKQYRATITSGAFKSTTGAAFDGLSVNADWTFTAVDPSMTVEFAGNGIRFNDGINQSELASNTLEVVGQISSVNRSAVTNARITKIMFISSDTDGSFELTDGLPTVNATTFQWTLANNTRWTSQLQSGKTYTVAAQLEANVIDSAQNSTPITPVVARSSLAVLVDTKPPVLTSVTCDKTFVKAGDIAEFTFTFDEDPKDTFNIDNGTSSLSDLIVAKVGGQDVGKFLSLIGTGNVRKALFRASDNVTFTSTASAPTVTIAANSFADAAGNVGTMGAGVVLPNLNIDTQGPQVRSVAISGINSTGQEFTNGTLVVGDRVRVTIGFDEVTRVIGVPIFKINVGGVEKQTKYVRGNGSNTLVFEYTVALGDSDNAGGITAGANGFELSFSGIQDTFGNEATTYSTPAVNAGANALTVLTTGSFTALEKIKKFAEDNADPSITDAQDTTSAIPTVKDYEDAGVTGVDDANLSSINNALRTQVIRSVQVDTAQKLQNLVSAYRLILAFANGDGSDHTNADNPDFLQYALIGVQGVDSVQASLLGDVIDFKQKQDVDTIPEIQDLANAVAAVINQSKNVAGLTLDQLKNKLNIQAATEDNFAAVKRAITAATTSGVDTWQELNDVVNAAATKATNAFNLLKAFADVNRESLPITNNGTYQGTVPTWSTYTDAGIASVAGISNDDLKNIINDALATNAVTSVQIDSFVKLQNLVNAYSAIVGLANGTGGTPIADLLGASGYNAIGVTGLEPNAILRDRKAQLLSSVIDRKQFDDINTVKEIQSLSDAVSAVMANAAGAGAVTKLQLKLLGFEVPDDKLADVIKAIDDTNNDGTEVDTYGELDSIITGKLGSVDQAVRLIANFAGLNAISKPTPQGTFVYDGTAPTAQTYVNAGVTGPVSDDEAAAFNDALATNAVGFASVDTAQEIKDLAAAYRTVLATANGPDVLAPNKPTLEQYGLLGVAGLVNTNLVVQASRVSLLNDVIDRKTVTDVDTVLEIQALVNIVTRVIQQANSVDGLTIDDLSKLGIQNVTPENFAAVLQAIRDTDDQGTGVDTYIELQDLVTGAKTKYDQALSFIKAYAKNRTDPTQLGTTAEQPTLDTYKNLGVTKVTVDNLKSINSALATASVTDVEVSSVLQVQNLVDAYERILKAAGNQAVGDVINPNDYTLLGISSIGSNAAKIKLLSEVIDRKTTTTSIDTADKLQVLANTVSAVVEAAGTGTGLINAQQLTDLGITGVNADNFRKVLAAIQGTVDDGTGVDTVKELQDLVNGVLGTQATALQAIKDFAEANTTSQPLTATGFEYVKDVFIPVAQTYTDAGVTGVISANDAAAFNDALATSAITASSVSDTSKLQLLVDAYRKVFALADGPTNPTTAPALTLVEYQRLGVEVGNLQSGGNVSNRLGLLNDIVDRKSVADVNTINEINQLIKVTNAIQDSAAGLVSSYALSPADFTALGLRGVTDRNIGTFLSAIGNVGADATDRVQELQDLLFSSLTVNFNAVSDDTGFSNSDFITTDRTLTFSGTSNAADGTKIRIVLKRTGQSDIALEGTVTNGLWQLGSPSLADGDYSVSAQLYDGTTLLPKVSAFAQHVQVDNSAINFPDGTSDPSLTGKTITFTGISPDTGVQGDFKTSNPKLIFSGTSNAANGTHVGISIDGGVLLYTTVQQGNWQLDNSVQSLTMGDHLVTAYLTDSAGNTLGAGVSHTVTIDVSSLTLLSKTTGAIASSASLVLNFSTAVNAVAGNFIHITDESNNVVRDILVTSSQVSISGATVTILPTGINQLVAGKNYHATIDAGAFVSIAGASYDGLSGVNDWSFRTVDPTTTVIFGGNGVDASNGLNATEVANLTVSGVISSPSLVSVLNSKITKLSFISADGVGSFDITTGLPAIGANQTWTLSNNTSWTSLLRSGKNYSVAVQLESDISGTHQTSIINPTPAVLVDTVSPGLTITNNVTQLGSGQTALFTFTFDEVPVGFTQSDVVVTKGTNGIDLGTLSNFTVTADPKIYTVTFTPNAGLTLPSTSLISVSKTSYTDVVGNIGKADASANTILLDTQAPTVSAVVISGVTSANLAKTANLDVGDKIKITLTLSEVVTVTGSPIFAFDLGGTNKTATYDSGNGTNTLVFYYTIVQGDNDSAGGITALANAYAAGILSDALGNQSVPTTPAVAFGSNTLVVDTTASALATLAGAAQANTASPTVTPLTLYAKAGVTRLDANNLSSYNSALNSAPVAFNQADTTSEVQDIVDAYNTLLKLADNGVSVGTFATFQQYQLIGVTGLDSPTTVSANDKAQLLSDAIDRKVSTDVDTVAEVQTLADAVIAVMKAANGVVSGAGTLTRAQLEALGVQNLTDTNMPAVLAAIAATADDGTAVNTVAKLQALVDLGTSDATRAAITLISNFAADNSVSSNTGSGATFAYAQGLVKPQLKDYLTAGVAGVTAGNIDAINDALATASVDRLRTNTINGIQKVVDAYTLVFALADGSNGTSGVPLQASKFNDIGGNIGNATDGSNNLKLLNSVMDFRVNADVDTVEEINTLSAIINAIMDSTGGRQASSANLLTAANLTKLGLGGVTDANISGILASIAAQSNGANIALQGKLQSLVNFYRSPAPTVALVADTGVNTQDGRTNNASLTFGAPSFSGATTYVSIDGGVTYVRASDYKPPTTSGTYNVLVRQVSAEGFLGQPSSSLTLTYDATTPNAVKLTPSSSTDEVNYGASDFGKSKLIAPNVQLANDGDIAIITLSLIGASAATDRITYQSGVTQVPVSLSADAQFTSLTIGGVTGVNLKYTASSQTFEFLSDASRASRVFSNAEVQAIERALGFTTSSQTTSSRTLKLSHTDVAGNSNAATGAATVTLNIDNTPPSKIQFSSNSQQESGSYNEAAKGQGLAVAIAANLLVTSDSDIAKMQLTIGGAGLDIVNDRVVFGDGANPQSLSLGADASGTGLSIGGVTGANWNYAASTKILSFSLNNNGVFTGAMLQNLEAALKFQVLSSATNITQGARTFTFDHVDRGGLSTNAIGNGATKTIVVDTIAPGDIDLGAAIGVQSTFVVGYGGNDKNTNKVLLSTGRSSVTDTDITTLVITAGGLTGSEVLTLQDALSPQTIALSSSSPSASGVTVGGVSVNWSYSGSDKKLSITKSNGSAFTPVDITAIENAIFFKETTGTAAGPRTFVFTHLDQAGNTSTTSTVTVDVDYANPPDIDLDSVTTGLQTALTSYYNASSTGSMSIAPKVALASGTASDRYSAITITITIAGKDVDIGADKLIYGIDFRTFANAAPVQGNLSDGTAYTFNGSTLTLRSAKSDGSGWSANEVNTIESSVAFMPSTKQGERTFTFQRTDVAGNVSNTATQTIIRDTILPSVFDLNTDTPAVDNTITQSLNKAQLASNATVLIAPKMGLVNADTDIKFFSMLFDGSKFDLTNDTLTVNGATIALNVGDVSAAGQTIAGVSNLNWNYFSSSAVKVLVFSKRDQSSLTAADVKAIGQVLGFSTTSSSTTTAGNERTFSFSLTDQAGNKSLDTPSSKISIDNVAPVIAAAGSTTNLDQTLATPTTGIALASNGTVVEAGGIGSIQLKVRGLRSGSVEKLVVNGAATEIDASGSGTSGSFTFTATSVIWNWRYNSITNTFNFSTSSNNATAAQAQALLNSLTYKTTAATADDVRQFAFTATDVAGNISNEAVSKVGVATQTPNKFALNAITVLDGNNDGFKGDQFVITFNEPVKVSSLSNPSGWTLSSGNGTSVSLAGASMRAVDGVSFNGQTYATNFWVTLASGSNMFVGQEQTLTLSASGNNASNSYVKLPNFTLTSQAITLEAWVYANYTAWPTTGTGFQRIFDLGSNTAIAQAGAPGTNLWLGFNGTTGKLQFQYFNNAGASPTASANLLTDNVFALQTWQHVAAVYGGTTMEVYVNGVSVKQVTGVGALAASNAFTNIFIGKSNFAADSGLNGSLFDARIYSNARSATEIGNDFKGAVDLNDAKMVMRYELNGNLNNTALAATKQGVSLGTDVASAVNTPAYGQTAGTSLTLPATNVEDVGVTTATGSVTFQLFGGTRTAGTALADNLTGTAGNDFLAGQKGDDTLTGGAGSDTFAWLQGDTGTDVVTDFKVGEGDMVNLSGILSGRNLGPNNTASELSNFLQLSVSGNDVTLRIDPTGLKSFAATTTQIIVFTNGALNGLDDTVLNLVKNKTLNLGAETSTPLMLDLDGNGVHTTFVQEGVAFDVDGYGQQVQTGWTDGKDGLLVLDLNGDGRINNGTELFGSGTQLASGSKAKDGFEALRQYDANKDGIIDAKDSVFAKLKVWVDVNHDGVSAPQELHTLTDLGVQALALNATPSTAMDNGNALMLASTWQSVDGRNHAFVDVNFTTTYLNGHAVL